MVHPLVLCACGDWNEVVVYVSHDQVLSEPSCAMRLEVRAVYDTEEAKGTGVMNRLLAERAKPQADVYWANEPIRADLLRQEQVTEPQLSPGAEGIPVPLRDPGGHWTGFAARGRVLVVHEDVADPPEVPSRISRDFGGEPPARSCAPSAPRSGWQSV